MIKTSIIITLLAIATSYLLLTPTKKSSYYHSLFISNSLSDNVSVSNNLKVLTHRPHIAGSEANNEAAAYVVSILTSSNIPTHVTSYDVALAYPFSRSLVLTNSSTESSFSFNLRQESYEGDPYADVIDEVVPTFHAYAKSGTAIFYFYLKFERNYYVRVVTKFIVEIVSINQNSPSFFEIGKYIFEIVNCHLNRSSF